MSQEKSVSQKSAVTTASDAPVPITPEAMVEQLRILREQIPEYVQLPAAQIQSKHSVANLNRDFSQAALNAIGASATVQGVIVSTPEELQTEAETADRWTKVEDELRAMLKGVASANLNRRHHVGQAVLLTYALSKKLVLSPEHADLLPHVDEMRRANRLGNSKSKKQPQPQAPALSSTPEPTPAPTTQV
jgi:hypothetical protein